MAASKRQKLEEAAPSPKTISDLLRQENPLRRGLHELLESPYDWHFLQCTFTGCQALRTQTQLCAERYKAEMKAWDEARLAADMAKAAPDGDRILFFAGSTRIAKLCTAKKLLEALHDLATRERVGGWQPGQNDWDLFLNSGADTFVFGTGAESSDRTELTDRGVVKALVRLMEEYPDSQEVQEGGCSLLWKLRCSWQHRLLPRCCFLLVNAMEGFPGNVAMHKAAILAIHRLQRRHKTWLFSCEAIHAIGSTLDLIRDSEVRKVALIALRYLVKRMPEGEDAAHQLALSTFLKATETDASDPALLSCAWFGIANCLKRGVCSSEFLGQHLGMAKIIGMFHLFNDPAGDLQGRWKAELNVPLFKAWSILCTDSAAVAEVTEPDVVAVLALQSKEWGRMKHHCLAFGHLAKSSASWATCLSKRGYVAVVVRCMEVEKDASSRFWDDGFLRVRAEKRLACCLFALSQLNLDPQNSLRAIRMTLWAMAHCKALEVQLHGAAMLSRLEKQDVPKASEFQACDAVLAALRAHEEEAMKLEGCRALSALMLHKVNKVKLAAAGGVTILLNTIDSFPANRRLKDECRRILKSMSRDAEAVALAPELRLVSLFGS